VLCFLQPVIDRENPVVYMTEVIVAAGQPKTINVGGPGAEMLQSCVLHLGQHVGPLEVLLKDELGVHSSVLSPVCCATISLRACLLWC
jgi:hypothetical protein